MSLLTLTRVALPFKPHTHTELRLKYQHDSSFWKQIPTSQQLDTWSLTEMVQDLQPALEAYSRRDCYCWDWFLTRWPEMTWSPLSLPPPRSGWSPRRSAPSAGLPRLWTGSFHRWRRAPDPRRLLHLTTAAFLGWLKVLLTLQTPGKRRR